MAGSGIGCGWLDILHVTPCFLTFDFLGWKLDSGGSILTFFYSLRLRLSSMLGSSSPPCLSCLTSGQRVGLAVKSGDSDDICKNADAGICILEMGSGDIRHREQDCVSRYHGLGLPSSKYFRSFPLEGPMRGKCLGGRLPLLAVFSPYVTSLPKNKYLRNL